MAGFQVEQAVCRGRGFNAPAGGGVAGGFMYLLMQFMVKTLAAGGPGWFLVDDQSALGTDPYVVFSDQNAAGPNVPAKYVQVLLPSATGSEIRVFNWIYWDSTLHVGRGPYGAYNVRTDDSIDFIYDFRGGPECLFLMTFTTNGLWEGAFIDEFTPDANLIDSVSATTAVANFVGADLQFRGIDFTANIANALDGSFNTYGKISFVSGTTWRFALFADVSRTTEVAAIAFSALANNTVQNVLSLTAQNGSGVTANVYLQGPTAADATIVFRPNRITVGAGEGAQFVALNFYFAYEMTNRNAVNAFQVLSKSGDVLVVDRLYRPFPIGTKIGSYPHKYFASGTGTALMSSGASVPYYNVAGNMSTYNGSGGSEQNAVSMPSGVWINGNAQDPAAYLSSDDAYLTTMTPDRKGNYAVQRPGVAEYRSFGRAFAARDGVSAYGQLKNVLICPQSTMSPNIHGRRLSGIDYTFFRTQSAYVKTAVNAFALLFRETESLT